MKSIHLSLAALFVLAACGGSGVKDTLGLSRRAPDEFRVVSRPPLSVPPQFSLQPPSTASTAPAALATDQQAKSLLTGTPATQENTFILQPASSGIKATPVTKAGPSSPEDQFLRNAGADKADTSVRGSLIEEKVTSQQEEEDSSWWDIMSTSTAKKEPTVDAKKEADRIQKNEDTGKPVTEGDTPEVKGRDTGVLGRIFGY